jgi:hypothetical protein
MVVMVVSVAQVNCTGEGISQPNKMNEPEISGIAASYGVGSSQLTQEIARKTRSSLEAAS